MAAGRRGGRGDSDAARMRGATPAWCAVAWLWVWFDEPTLTKRFAKSVKIGRRLFRGVPKVSYQAFLKLLGRHTAAAWTLLRPRLRGRMQTALSAHFEVAGFPTFGVDGSRLGLARTASNEARFSPASAKKPKRRQAKRGRKSRSRRPSAAARARRARNQQANSPPLWLTTMWHAGTGLPWDWRIGPSDSSARVHLLEMLDELPAHALVTGDAGFAGYESWKAILDRGRHFVIRVGGNVRLLKRLGVARESANTVDLWPDKVSQRNEPPLVLRLVVLHDGHQPWFLVTSVLEQSKLTDAHVARIDRARWGVEVFYRHFQQTFGRRKLRSHAAANVETEAHWSLLGLWAMLLYAQTVQHRHHIAPGRSSVANILHAFHEILREYKSHPDPGESFQELLLAAVLDDDTRTDKTSRNHPTKKAHEKTHKPSITTATKSQVTKAKQLHAA